jgi:hypothetical protein
MSNDPRNYFYNRRNNTANTTTQQTNGTPNTGDKSIDEKVRQMQALAKKYEKGGESQLVKDIVSNVIEQKAKGQLTNDQLVAFAKKITPLLNAEQRQRLNALVDELVKL